MSKRRGRLSSSSIVLDYLQFKTPPRRRWRMTRMRGGEGRGGGGRGGRRTTTRRAALSLCGSASASGERRLARARNQPRCFTSLAFAYASRTRKPCNLCCYDGLKDFASVNRVAAQRRGSKTENVKSAAILARYTLLARLQFVAICESVGRASKFFTICPFPKIKLSREVHRRGNLSHMNR